MSEFVNRMGDLIELVLFCVGLGVCIGIVIRVARWVGLSGE